METNTADLASHTYSPAVGFEDEAREILQTWARLKVTESRRGFFVPVTSFAISGPPDSIAQALTELAAARERWWMGLNF